MQEKRVLLEQALLIGQLGWLISGVFFCDRFFHSNIQKKSGLTRPDAFFQRSGAILLYDSNMWCFVSEPNGIIHEIFLPNNAIGQDCFDRVLYDFHGRKEKLHLYRLFLKKNLSSNVLYILF